MRLNMNIRSVAWVAAQVRATTTLFTLWAVLGGVALPGLAGADGSCADVTSESVRYRADVRAAAECAPTATRPDGTAAAQGHAPVAGVTFGEAHANANGFAPVTGRSQAKVPARVPDPPPVVGSTWTNTLGAEFKWIPAGKFIMGSPADEEGRSADEVQHSVTISAGFWMGKLEVTLGDWVAVMGKDQILAAHLEKYPEAVEYPTGFVSWEYVQEFIRKLNEREFGRGYVYRLPTEAEWEYAARAGTTGARYGELGGIAWHPPGWLLSQGGGGSPRIGGLKKANAWGLHDMLGNFQEWTADWYGAYPTGAVTDPTGPSTGTRRVIRGGAVNSGWWSNRAAWRGVPEPLPRNCGICYFGLRLVRTMPAWTNTLGMEFAWIRPGRFHMGSPEKETGRRRDEIQHPVQFSTGYWLGTHEVTRGEWRLVMGSLPLSQPHCGRECPVGSVSWADTQEFLRKLHVKESGQGTRYRLPTEAEWEYAARAGTTGARYGELDKVAWYAGNSGGRLSPVGLKPANAWGLHDMLGNVWEWTADWYGTYRTYNGFAAVSPTGPRTGSLRVFRGGNIHDIAGAVRAADRRSASPRTRNDALGLRLAMTSPRAK